MRTLDDRTEPSPGAPTLTPYVPRILLRHLVESPDEMWWTAEGSVVLVDISGFTSLSEKLARAGREGAEQLTDALETCFIDLLGVAYANGGSLIKFGGDALLLWFEGEEHAANACRSAVWMMRALRDVGRIEVPGARARLRMSVGIHTDTFQFFHIGASHRELVVTGPGWSRAVEMERTAEAGEIVVSPEVAGLLPARCVGEVKGPGSLLRREPPGTPVSGPSSTAEVAPEIVAGCLSTALRAHVLEGGGTPEHRRVTVAFVQFGGVDAQIVERGGDAVARDLEVLVSDVQAACDEFGVCFLGSDANADGGKLILTAGAPVITGNDEERMLLTLRRIVDAARPIVVRAGVHRGNVFAGDIGPWYRRTYTVMGDAVNLAARLMARADPGAIYATADVLDASGTRFTASQLEPFTVKGKSKPVQAWAVGTAVGSRTRDDRNLPLIGRSAELAILRRRLAAAREGRGSLVELSGEPGIGKSRLLDELASDLDGVRVLDATAETFTSSTPYVLWRSVLRELLEVSWEASDAEVLGRLQDLVKRGDPSLTPWIPLLAIPVDADAPSTPEVDHLADEFRHAKLHEIVGRFLEVVLDRPTMLRIEDAHLMDGASGELLDSLLGTLGERPWLIAITRRGVGARSAAPTIEAMELQALDDTATQALAHAATEDAPLLPHRLQTVSERSGGNPQFLLDLIQVAATGAMLPESVESAAMARIDALAPSDRSLVRRVSVFGLAFHPRFLEDVLDADQPRPEDRTWERLAEFFQPETDGYLRFRRAVVRDAAYAGLPFRTRRRLHLAIGERWEREVADVDESGGLLSLHFFLAGSHAKAWRYARVAGTRAASQFANQEAVQLFRRAIDAARRLPEIDRTELAAVHEQMAACHIRSGDYKKAADSFGAARRLYQGDALAEARMLFERSRVEDSLGRYREALRWATKARNRLGETGGPEAGRQRAKIDAWYATVLQSAGRLSEAIRWCERAIGEAELANEPRALAQANFVLGWSDTVLGRPGAAHMQRALEIYEELDDLAGQAHMSVNLGAAAYFEGRWDDARSSWERARELFLEVGDAASAAMGDVNIAQVLTDQGRLDEAEPVIRGCVRIYRASGDPYLLGSSLGQLARILSRRGMHEDAARCFEDALDTLARAGAQAETIETDALRLEALVSSGRAEDALAGVAETLMRIASIGGESVAIPLLERVRAIACAQLSRYDEATVALDVSLQSARERGADLDVVLALTTMERLARLRGEEPEPREEARTILTRLGVIALPAAPMTRVG